MKEESSRGSSRPKRRRVTGTDDLASGDHLPPPPPDIWALEEDEVEKRDSEKDLQLYKQTCGNIRRIMREILELKKLKKTSSEITEKRIQGSLMFVLLRKLNRYEKLRNKKARDATNEAKVKVDTHHLQLQNLLYEVTHLNKEVKKCMEFKSKDEDIPLVPIDEFYKEAPPEISKYERTKTNPHEQTLARLEWELEQRKRLALQCKEAEANKTSILADIKKKKEYLEALGPCLNSILEATLPVQDKLGMNHEVKSIQNKVAAFLPTPLYILYVQASSYAEAWEKKITVAIEGDVDEARSLKELSDERDEESGDSDQEENQGTKHYRRSSTNKVTDSRKKILRKHPLVVTLQFDLEHGDKLKLEFSYVILLRIVTVIPSLSLAVPLNTPSKDVLSQSCILDSLFPNDRGLDTPNLANHYQLKRLGMEEFKAYISELGYPYYWAQCLSGLEFARDEGRGPELPPLPPPIIPNSKVSFNHMEQIMFSIAERMNARIVLQKLLFNLEQGVVPVDPKAVCLYPSKIATRLTSFVSVTWAEIRDFPQLERVIEIGVVSKSYFPFMAIMERGSAKLFAATLISPNYPQEPPVFLLRTSWKEGRTSLDNAALWDIEKEVNFYWDELIQLGSRYSLLANQIQRLLMCFDVYVEAEGVSETVEGPQEFPKEKVFFQQTRGRTRTKPYKYAPELGLFIHR